MEDRRVTAAPDDPLDRCRAALAALAASEARFRNVIEKNADGVVVVGGEGEILYMNPAAEALFGCRVGDCVGRPFGIPVVPDEQTEVDVPRHGGAIAVAEMRVVETEWEGRPAFLASLRDVTARKRAEDALKEADRRKDEFLAMLAHELRNPLAAVTYAFRVMDAPDAADEARTTAERQLRHLARLVDDLLDVSRITRGKIELRKEPVDLVATVRRVVAAAGPHAEARGQRLAVALPPGRAVLEADPVRLEQVFANLVGNALKYTSDGGPIEVSVEVDGAAVAVRVRDGGVGIAPDVLPHVFDPFTQADRSLDRAQGGLGIGLTLVRRLTELHGGTVSAVSDGPGHGSEFIVRLPLPAKPAPSAEPRRDGRMLGRSDGRSLRILLVEDQVGLAQMFARLLERRGHAVRVVHDGPSALEAAPTFRPQLVLLDIGLPGMSGYEVAERLRDQPGVEHAALVALTGYGQEEALRRSREAGFHRHLVKPVSLATLEEVFVEVEGLAGPDDSDRDGRSFE